MEPSGGLDDRPSPRPPISLLGRDAERAHLDDLIDQRRGIITITGRGGVGKSALALDVADRRREAGRERIFRLVRQS